MQRVEEHVPKPASSESNQIFIHTHRRDFGPYTESEFKRHVSGGRVPFSAWVYIVSPADGQARWQLLAELPTFRESHPQFEEQPTHTPKGEEGETLESVAAEAASTASGAGTVSVEPIWFVIRDKKKFGPYSSADIISKLQRKELDSTCFVWRPGFSTWQRLNSIADFSRDAMKKLVSSGTQLDVIVKRKKPRALYEVEVIAHDNTRAVEGKTMVIGEGGLFLAVSKPSHSIGARLKLHFREGDTPPFNAVAEIVSVVRGESPGYCMKFVALSESDRKKIGKLVSERRNTT